MAYIYNEKTGEFINTSDQKPKSTPSSSTRPTATTPSSAGSRDGSSLGGCLAAIGGLILYALPYLLICGLVSLCS